MNEPITFGHLFYCLITFTAGVLVLMGLWGFIAVHFSGRYVEYDDDAGD